MIAAGHLTFGFDEQGVESSLALVFGLDVPLAKDSKTKSQVTKHVRVLQIYYEAPVTEDVPPGVFGGTRVEGSAWKEETGTHGARTFQYTGGGGPAGSAGGTSAPADTSEDGPTATNTPVPSSSKSPPGKKSRQP